MGKAGDAEQAAPGSGSAASDGSDRRRCAAAVGKALSAKCVFVLFLAVGVSLSAFFMLLHLRASGIIADDPGTLVGEIQAGFVLLKPPSELASDVGRLEQEIYREIGVPNSKVSVSMQTFIYNDSTYVKFGILPDPRNTFINAQSMHTLRKNLIRLTLQQLNLSLTPSVFGDPFCFEMLGFPGGITMELTQQYISTVEVVQHIFNITLDMSIHQIRGYIKEMKINLGHTLEQPPDKEVHIDLTNKNGSTVTPPVTVQVSLSLNDRSIYQLPYRQLVKIIIESYSRNLGLNPSVFGRIMDLKLAPYLQVYNTSFAPSSSPMPTPMPSSSRPLYSQPTTTDLCEHCSCPDLVKRLNATFPHRKLKRLSPMAISSQLPTQLHSRNRSRHKKNIIAVAAPTFIRPASRP